MKININKIYMITGITNCMTVKEIQQTTARDDHIQQLRQHIIRGWCESRNEVPEEIRLYWTFKDDMAMIYCIVPKGR